MSHTFGQSSSYDPESLFILSDSINRVDTVKLEVKREFLQLCYVNELSLYHFDKLEKHLLRCIQYCDQMAREDRSSKEPLLQGMRCGNRLTNDQVIGKFYRLLVDNKLEKKLTENEKYEVDQYVGKYNLNSYAGTPKFFGKATAFDTTVTILSNKRLVTNDLQHKEPEFVKGDSTYLEIIIIEAKRKNPKSSIRLIVLISDSEIPDVMLLSDNNCVYASASRSIIFDSKPVAINGKLVHNEFGLYILIQETELPNRTISTINTIWISPDKLGQ